MAIGGQLPTPENISAGRYAFWSFEHMYTIGAFLDFMLTPQIQRLAQQLGYIPIAQMKLAGTGGRPVGEVSHEAAQCPRSGSLRCQRAARPDGARAPGCRGRLCTAVARPASSLAPAHPAAK